MSYANVLTRVDVKLTVLYLGCDNRPMDWSQRVLKPDGQTSHRATLVAGALAVVMTCICRPAIAAEAVDFDRDIRPILAEKCFACHGPDDDARQAELRLDNRDGALAAFADGRQAIAPGNADASVLLERVSSHDDEIRMPPADAGERLTDAEIENLRIWIEAGAPWEEHWSWRPLNRSPPPAVQHADWVRNPIDAYVLARLEEANIEPSPRADRTTLIKRLSYDLIGLPPTPDEADAFLADESATAYESLVNRLLAAPHFGERWGRHWLDKARFADTNGYESDTTRTIWPFRDWVIDAINRDLPFDQFTIEQIAGDLLPASTTDQVLATAFHRNTMTNFEGGTDDEEFRFAAVVDRVNTTMQVWMGITAGCAQCHDHKYDPFTQQNYYELFAYFNQSQDADAKDNPPLMATPTAWDQARREGIESEIARLEQIPTTSPTELQAARAQLAEFKLTMTPIMRDLPPDEQRQTHIHARGDFRAKTEQVAPDVPELFHSLPSGAAPNRLSLARWLVDRNNPLTPRVTVNHIWRHLFGAGIVRTVNDFGTRGERPQHPGMLDYLADRFVWGGWSRKELIRHIVLSATYQQSSRHRAELVDIDPTNTLLYRQNRFRVEAEIVRDVHLAASGLLSEKIGGPSVYPPIPPGITTISYNEGFNWDTSAGEDKYRRGMYTFFKRTAPHPNLTTFDCPESSVACLMRNRSNTPLGALITLNNVVFIEAAQALAQRVLSAPADDDRQKLILAFRLCLTRTPEAEEMDRLVELLESSRTWYQERPEDATERVGAFGVDGLAAGETAAWISVARVIMNLDEFITRD